ncbi:MAG: NUMOD4 motif-containing HNH endonuclease [Microbacterium sp.]|uniref:NUMOD4 motif-containing HNH endonuclease n=1 Tax=Microbacterium sp. TaxID=51671 RepID=UPI0025D27BA7|nr:NUMOD4 motif-containing HNH endonuclease [Microbacterium sp.]MBQ9917779.1 NUMOD4 motif-containing HNH endonuclease [Microbacterium sp.]
MPVAGYEGEYEVSDLGRVRSLPRLDARGHRLRGRMLRATGSPYLSVSLCQEGVPRTMQVHRLVLEVFVGPCPESCEALHGDSNPRNNRLTNLRWGTRAENNRDIVLAGHHPGRRKTTCPLGHPLIAPNLRRADARRGHRACRACGNARTWARDRGIEFNKAISDRYYAAIVANEGGVQQ